MTDVVNSFNFFKNWKFVNTKKFNIFYFSTKTIARYAFFLILIVLLPYTLFTTYRNLIAWNLYLKC